MRVLDLVRVPMVALVLAAPAAAQQAPAKPVANTSEPKLVFEREVFNYAGRMRRDPFRPLTAKSQGPLFTDLTLHMILYSEDPANSVVAVSDAAKKQYRLRRGDTVGNATVIDIGPTRVVFSVMDFGIRRQEVLHIKPDSEGA
ncbi:MAG TPA: hypothetical protein VK936_05965 [Longimicrobiales bacterium]|nr:hypothetical protein [Longimicrobiales bacterium]